MQFFIFLFAKLLQKINWFYTFVWSNFYRILVLLQQTGQILFNLNKILREGKHTRKP